jgi:hypothetical protein
MAESITIQTGAHQYTNSNLTKYSLMMGGLNVTHDVLEQYDPLVTGYYRLFMVRKPHFLTVTNPDKLNRFKHILEYGNTGVDDIGDVELEMDDMKGGYAGRSFSVPTVAKDGTSGFTVKCYEYSGSPIRELLHCWINGISDIQSGLAHYNGAIASGDVRYSQANHTAEFIYVVTDRTGMHVEYACQFANCMPKGYKNSQFNNGSAGDHAFVETEINFTATKYESIDINKKASILLQNNQILVNSLEFYSGIDTIDKDKNGSINTTRGKYYDSASGEIKEIKGLDSTNTLDKNAKFFTGKDSTAKFNTDPSLITPSYTTKGAITQ